MAPGHLYVIQFENGLIKIGRATNPVDRVRDHRSAGEIHGNPLNRVWVGERVPDPEAAEADLLDQCPTAIHGREWFMPPGRINDRRRRHYDRFVLRAEAVSESHRATPSQCGWWDDVDDDAA